VTCAALVLAAVGDAGPEIIASRSPLDGYDGPGPLIYLGVAAIVAATVRWWRFVPLLAVVTSAFFLVGGLADADFAHRLATPAGIPSAAAWLQMLGFAVAAVAGTAAVWPHRAAAVRRS
jgi:hypothetical protein